MEGLSAASRAADIDQFVDAYAQAIHDETAAVFAGAGLSIPAGLVNWATLLREIALEVGLDVEQEADLVSVAQYHVNEKRGRHRLNQALITEFAEQAKLTRNHALLAQLPIRLYWTTNYDTLLEEAARAAGKRPDVKRAEIDLTTTLPRRDVVINKMHGDVSQADKAILTRDDYEGYPSTHPLMSTALRGDLVSKTFLFIGFSFNDPNLSYILSRIRVLLGQNRRDHYCLLRRVQVEDFKERSQYDYARGKQDLQVRDLLRYGINGILVDSYEEYTAILERIASKFKRRVVFVSGSATSYSPWSESEAIAFIRDLGAGLINARLDLVTGFGAGVGAYLLNGALAALAASGSAALHDRVILRPFPQGIADPKERAARWTAYRSEMVSHAGIAVFIFGNRTGDGRLILSDGVREEFELSAKSGLVLVPVGATGYMSEALLGELSARAAEFGADTARWRSQIETLRGGDRADLAQRIAKLVSSIAKEA